MMTKADSGRQRGGQSPLVVLFKSLDGAKEAVSGIADIVSFDLWVRLTWREYAEVEINGKTYSRAEVDAYTSAFYVGNARQAAKEFFMW